MYTTESNSIPPVESQIHPWQTDGRSTIRTDVVKRLSGTAGSKVFGIIQGFVLPKLLAPDFYGIWNTLQIIVNYGLISHLGVFFEMNRRLPELEVQNKPQEYVKVRQAAFGFSLLMSLLFALGVIIGSFLPVAHKVAGMPWAIRLIAIVIVLQNIYIYQNYNLRSLGKFGILSLTEVLFSFLFMVFGLGLTYKYGFLGTAAGYALTFLTSIWVIRKHNPIDQLRLYWTEIKPLISSGLPLLLMSLATTLRNSVGQIIIVSFLGLYEVGLYSLGVMLSAIIYTVPVALASVFYPRYLRNYGLSRDGVSIGDMIRSNLFIVSVSASVIIAYVILLLEFVVKYYLTKYTGAVIPTYVMLTGMAFMSLILVVGDPLVAIRRQNLVLGSQLVLTVFIVLLAIAAIKMGWGITGVAAVIASANLLNALFLVGMTLKLTSREGEFKLKELWRDILISTIIIMIAFVCLLWPLAGNNLIHDLGIVIVRLLIFTACISPFFWKLYKFTSDSVLLE